MKKLLLLTALLIGSFVSVAQILTPQQMMFPTSNGDSLEVDVYLPNTSGTFPVILIQTPYGKFMFRNGLPLGIGRNLSTSDYAFVVMDWRGRFSNLSKADPAVSIGEDGYDLVEWIAQQSWSTGKIGTWGPSALGNVQFETAKKRPPNLTCAIPVVASPRFFYEDYYQGGVAKTELLEQLDNLGFGVSRIVSSNPYYNLVWQISEQTSLYPDSIQVPMLMIAGWYDHNIDAAVFQYDTCSKKSPLPAGTKHHFLVGPWAHGGNGTAFVGTANQGQLNYPNAAGINDTLSLQFFDYHLRNINNGWNLRKPVMYYQMGDEQWLEDSQWPVTYTTSTNYYLQQDGSLKTTPSTADSLTFSYNPSSPSPTVGGPTLRNDLQQGPYDQVPAVESRFDLLTFETAVSSQDLKIKGRIEANLFVSSDKPDTDIAIRITDVYPDGRSMLIMDGIQRMRFRNGYRITDTAFMQPGQVYPVNIKLSNTAITIKAGHKLRIIVTGSNYPRFNRNMNNGAEMYPGNNLDSVLNPQFAINKIHVGSANPSHIVLPIDNTSTSLSENELFRVSVFPNPSNNYISIRSEEQIERLKIMDISGKTLLTPSSFDKIDVTNLKKGMYLILIESSRGMVTKRFIKI